MERTHSTGNWQTGPAAGLRILVVDDYPDCAESMALLLRLYGHEPFVARSGEAALELVRTHNPDVVLLDISLPDGMDGWELAKRLREQPGHGDRLLVAVTGYGRENDRQRSAECGIAAHLTKPVDPEELRAILDWAPYRAGQS